MAYRNLLATEDTPKQQAETSSPNARFNPKRSRLTVYQLISSSEHATKFAELVNQHPIIVAILNNTASNVTILLPTNAALDKFFRHDKNLSKEHIREILLYHIHGPLILPASFLPLSPSQPTLLDPLTLSGPQRWRSEWSLKGLTINIDVHIIAFDIYVANGVIHTIDSILVPPPSMQQTIEQMPGKLSTLALALRKASSHVGNGENRPFRGTCFAPSNKAFEKLGVKANAFLFTDRGKKYLEALPSYHFVPEITLYSNAKYNSSRHSSSSHTKEAGLEEWPFPDNGYRFFPKGIRRYTLPTSLDGHSLDVEIDRYGPLISESINGRRTRS